MGIAHARPADYHYLTDRVPVYSGTQDRRFELGGGAVAKDPKAVADNRRAYVLVNNRSEGNTPLTVQGLAEMLRV